MASPVTHIILALKMLSLLPTTIDRAAFLVGTSFPDIRYTAKLEKHITHIEPVQWSDIYTCSSSFKAGMLFHNLVDILRIRDFEPHFYNRNTSEICDTFYRNLFPLVLKFSEDSILYQKCQDWGQIITYFDIIYEEELLLCPNKDIIMAWHKALQNYFRQPPIFTTISNFLEQTGGNMEMWFNKEYFDSEYEIAMLLANQIFWKQLMNFFEAFIWIIVLEKRI